MSDPVIPDEMGAWDEDGPRVWLPRVHYPDRIDAIVWAMGQWDVRLPEVRCLSRFMRYTPEVFTYSDGASVTEDRWSLCEKDAEGAFPVWQLEPS